MATRKWRAASSRRGVRTERGLWSGLAGQGDGVPEAPGPGWRFDGTPGPRCGKGVRGHHQRGPVCCRRRLCSPALSGTTFGGLAMLGGVTGGGRCARPPATLCDPAGVGCGAGWGGRLWAGRFALGRWGLPKSRTACATLLEHRLFAGRLGCVGLWPTSIVLTRAVWHHLRGAGVVGGAGQPGSTARRPGSRGSSLPRF